MYLDGPRILEIPVTTMPIFKIPIHLTYLHFLAQKSQFLAKLYFQSALTLCSIFRVEPSILLHPLDFLGADRVPELKDFPGMGQKTQTKTALTVQFLKKLKRHYTVLSLSQYAELVSRRKRLKTVAI